MKYVILKLSAHEENLPFTDDAKLLERASEGWKLTPRKLGDAKRALLLFRGQVLNEYEIGHNVKFDRFETKIKLDLKQVQKSQYKGKMVNYKQPNKASILEQEDLDEKITLIAY